MEPGYYRVHLIAADGDWITLHAPLNSERWHDALAPKPHLLKASWSGDEYYGELVVTGERFNRIVWGGKFANSLTDLLRSAVDEATIFTVYETDDRDGERWQFAVRDIRRL